MLLQQNWAANAVKRIVANIFVGAILTAIVGALCVGAAGALFGWILDIRSTPASWDGGFMGPGLFIGLTLGAWSGIIGAGIGAVAALGARPGRMFAPLVIMKRVTLGQAIGTLGALSSHLIFSLLMTQLNAEPFIALVEAYLLWALIGVPVLMNCGAITGALWKPQTRTPLTMREAR